MATEQPEIISLQKKNSPQPVSAVDINGLKKEALIDYLLDKIGGKKSYYRALKKEGLKVLVQFIIDNPDGKEALAKLVQQQEKQADTNRRLGGQVSGLQQRVASRDRAIQNLMQHIESLKQQINQASETINHYLEELTKLEQSEILSGVKHLKTWLSKNLTHKI